MKALVSWFDPGSAMARFERPTGVLLVATLLCGLPAIAQESAEETVRPATGTVVADSADAPSGFFTELVDVRVINVEVFVSDSSGVPVFGLSPDDFELDMMAVHRKVQALETTKALRLAEPGVTAAKAGLNKPSATVEASYEDGTSFTLAFGAEFKQDERDVVYFTGHKDSPVERHLYRVGLDGGESDARRHPARHHRPGGRHQRRCHQSRWH